MPKIIRVAAVLLAAVCVGWGLQAAGRVSAAASVPATSLPGPVAARRPPAWPVIPPPQASEWNPAPQLPAQLNGVPLSEILVLPASVRAHMREIFQRGQSLGRDPHAFSKVGDSTMVWPPFLALFEDRTAYTLGPQYASLQATIDSYPGSFDHLSAAAKKSMHSWSEFDPQWVNNPRCRADEAPLDCELRIHNPSIVLIRLGANDVWAEKEFDKQMRRIVEQWLSYGVIPVLGTKPDRLDGPQNTLNRMAAQIAADYEVPFWDYDRIAATVPGKGLLSDHVHFRAFGSHDYTSSDALAAADSLQDLTGLMMLDAIRSGVESPAPLRAGR